MNGSSRLRKYIYLDDRIIAQVESNGSISYVTSDHLGTAQKLTDSNKNITWDRIQKPFGETYAINGGGVSNLRLPGMYGDTESSIFHNGFRDYNQNNGRYYQSDPLGLAAGSNTYAYVGGNPLNGIDPWGLRVLTEGEIAMAQTVFGNSINYSKVNINNYSYLPGQHTDTTMTPDGNMYFPSGSSAYQDDFSKASGRLNCHFMHEMTHVWQNQSDVDVGGRSIWGHLNPFSSHDITYDYSLSEGSKFSDYGIEQQAAIVSDYYALTQANVPTTHNVGPNPTDVNAYRAILPLRACLVKVFLT